MNYLLKLKINCLSLYLINILIDIFFIIKIYSLTYTNDIIFAYLSIGVSLLFSLLICIFTIKSFKSYEDYFENILFEKDGKLNIIVLSFFIFIFLVSLTILIYGIISYFNSKTILYSYMEMIISIFFSISCLLYFSSILIYKLFKKY